MTKLNDRQKEAVRYIDGPLLVLAGAGSGKTRVITQKILYLVRDCGIAARHIAAVTFTNKAAREMKNRVSKDLRKKESRGLKVSTFHHLGLNILRKDCSALGYKSGFSIYDAQDSAELIKGLMQSRYKSDDDFDQIQRSISSWKNALVAPQDVTLNEDDDAIITTASEIYEDYDCLLKSYNAVDFDDLIRLPVKLFSQHRDILEKWQNQIRYLLIDEYQDTNASQYRLVKLLAGSIGAFTVVGDDDQSIYAWRGAQPENLALLQTDYPRLKLIKLEQNYRSTGCILLAANELITHNAHVFEKVLWSNCGYGDRIRVLEARNEDHEMERVVSELLNHKFQSNSQFGEYAILYRGNHQSRIFERSLRENQIPYTVTGNTSFFAYAEIKDIMAYLQLMSNNDNDKAFLRIVNTPRREIGPTTITKLTEYANSRSTSLFDASHELGLTQYLPERAVERLTKFVGWLSVMSNRVENGEIKNIVNEIVEETNYHGYLRDNSPSMEAMERKMENINELSEWIARLVNNDERSDELGDVVSYLQLVDILERQEEDERNDSVSLMTLHSAKGLEYPHVFIVGMEEKLIPHRVSIEEDNIEEERRLAYVGITRAQKTLTFSLAQRRKRAGEMEECEPSRFLREIPEEHILWERLGHSDPVKRQQTGKAHLSNLRKLLGEPV